LKNEYPQFAFWEIFLVLLGWVFLNFRLIDYIYRFKFSYAITSLLLAGAILYYLKRIYSFKAKIILELASLAKLFPFILLSFLLLVPLGLVMGFLVFHFSLARFLLIPLILAGIYLTIGLVEELIFRQVLLVYLVQKFNFSLALVVSSSLFGLSHVVRGGFPNWHYVLLASIASLIYGVVFKKFGLASAIFVHSVIDTIKSVFFF